MLNKLQDFCRDHRAWILMGIVVIAMAGFYGYAHFTDKSDAPVAAQTGVATDTLALNVICTPTMESLPLYYAVESGISEHDGLNLAIHTEWAQMDVDSLFRHTTVYDAAVLDTYRITHYANNKWPLDAVEMFRLDGRWGLVTSGPLRIREIAQLKKRTIASARYSTSSHCLEKSLGGTDVKMKSLYHAQINNYTLRLQMLDNAQVEGALLPEPFLTAALQRGHRNMWVGDSINTLALCRRKGIESLERKKDQLERLLKVYNESVAELNARGIEAARPVLVKYYALPPEVAEKVHLPHYANVNM